MEIFVYADWVNIGNSLFVGTLRSSLIFGKEHFSFNYDLDWLNSKYSLQIDPALRLYVGEQHSADDSNFKVFLDSCPDRWGRLLMQRREAVIARKEKSLSQQLKTFGMTADNERILKSNNLY